MHSDPNGPLTAGSRHCIAFAKDTRDFRAAMLAVLVFHFEIEFLENDLGEVTPAKG